MHFVVLVYFTRTIYGATKLIRMLVKIKSIVSTGLRLKIQKLSKISFAVLGVRREYFCGQKQFQTYYGELFFQTWWIIFVV